MLFELCLGWTSFKEYDVRGEIFWNSELSRLPKRRYFIGNEQREMELNTCMFCV